MHLGSKQVEDSRSRLGNKAMGLGVQGSVNGKGNYYLEISEAKIDCSPRGVINSNVNGEVKSDLISEASANCVAYSDLNDKLSTREASDADSQLAKVATFIEESDTDQSTNGRALSDLHRTTDFVELTEAASDHVGMYQESNADYSSIESPQGSLTSFCHSARHEDKRVLLDPNAQEFTPAPLSSHTFSLNATPLSQPYQILDENSVYGSGVDIGPVLYNHNLINESRGLPVLGSNSPDYGPASAANSTWNGQPVRYVVQSDLLQQFSRLPLPVLPPTNSQQERRDCLQHPFSQQNHNSLMASPRRPTDGMTVAPTIMGREHVSRALLLSGVPVTNDDDELRCELEQWGPVRAMGLEKWQEGSVTVWYFDLRHSKDALKDIQEQHLLQQQRMKQHLQLIHKQQRQSDIVSPSFQQDVNKAADLAKMETFAQGHANKNATSRGLIGGKAVWAQYVVPFGSEAGPDSMNQGTLVVFNLDANVSLDALRAAFEVHGPVKELRETPTRRQHKFVEFFDVRDAARALAALDGKEVCGRRVKIEFSRPGGQARRARCHDQFQGQCQLQGSCSPCGNGASLSTAASHAQGQHFLLGWNGDCQSHIFPSPHAYWMSNCGQVPYVATFNSVSCVLPHWNGSELHPHPLVYAKRSMASCAATPQLTVTELLPSGAAVRDSGNGLYGGSRKGSVNGADNPLRRFRSGSVTGHPCSNFQNADGVKPGFVGARYGHIGKQVIPSKNLRDIVQTRYVFDEYEAELSSSSNPRTTLMIKNIPNKYSQQMLLELLDEHCLQWNKQLVDRREPVEPVSAYDFVYLPIDFKNKCNLGYAFVNFTTIQATVRFYKAFHEQQWEAFNSRKICEVTYARVQGKLALEEHFRNSRFNCEINEYLPLMFCPPRTGVECPPPTVAVCSTLGNSLQEDNGSAKIADSHENKGDEQLAP